MPRILQKRLTPFLLRTVTSSPVKRKRLRQKRKRRLIVPKAQNRKRIAVPQSSRQAYRKVTPKQQRFPIRLTTARQCNDKGEIFIDELRIGDYTISEVSNSASSMYVLPADKKATVKLGYPVTLGTDTFGNITRLDNALEGLPKRLEMNEMELDNIKKQFETAKVDVERPFPQEEELKAKTDRLNELNALLNVDKRENEIVGGEPDEGEEPPEKKPRNLER